MIVGYVTEDCTLLITVSIGSEQWCGVIDTGFNGDLELPQQLRPVLKARFIGRTRFLLAAGQESIEDLFLVDFPFDGRTVLAEATFTNSSTLLIGTGILKHHQLEIHFPNRSLTINQVT